MQLPPFTHLRPATLAEGLEALALHGDRARLIAGGTDLLVNMRFRLQTPKVLVSLAGIPELFEIAELDDGGMRIGAGNRLATLAIDPTLGQRYPALRDAIRSVGSAQIRQAATLGGNVCLATRCWYTNQSEDWRSCRENCFKTGADQCLVIKTADYCRATNTSDTAPVLIALGASLIVAGKDGQRSIPAAEFYRDDGVENTTLKPGEILVAVTLPPPAGTCVFSKLAQRQGLDFAAGTIAAALEGPGERPERVVLVLGSVATEPKLLAESAAILGEQGLTDEAIDAATDTARAALGPVTNLFTPTSYKARLSKALVRDALIRLREATA